jgi:hypothetical protein
MSRKFRPQQFFCPPKTKLRFHEAAEEYPLMPDDELKRLIDDMKANGFDPRFPIALYDGKILGGRNRYLAARKAGVDFLTVTLPKETDAQAFVVRENEHRRHLTPEWLEKRRYERLSRVSDSMLEGKSTRTIADEENISHAQARRDVETVQKRSGVPPGTPDVADVGKVVGKDGKEYPAKTKLLCHACETKKRKNQSLPAKCRDCAEVRKLAARDKKHGNNPDADTPEPPSEDKASDDLGNELPKKMRGTFAGNRKTLQDGVRLLHEVRRMCGALTKWNPFLRPSDLETAITKLADDLKNGLPYALCPKCESKGCKDCRQTGWMPKWKYEEVEK